MPKRIMEDFRIDEISAVDRPAQKGARARIMKRQTEDAKMEFQKRVDEIRKRDDCSQTEAMSKAREEFPDEYEAYQREGAASGREAIAKMHRNPRASDPVREFRKIVAETAARDGISPARAMEKARTENPAAYEAYQSA